MYLRKWTVVPFHEAAKLFRSTRHSQDLKSDPFFQLKPIDYQKGYDSGNQSDKRLEETLIKNLFNRYPELKYIPLFSAASGGNNNEHIAFKFLRKQMLFIKQGYTQQKAFDLAEQLYQLQMQRRIDSQLVSRDLAVSNNARSFLSFYQQQVEYESKLKTRRVERDSYIKNMENEKDDAEFAQQNEEDEISKNYDMDKYNSDLVNKYQKALYRIVAPGYVGQENEEKQQVEMCDDLVSKTKNLFEIYYQRASIKDRLNGLTDIEIQQSLMGSPKKVQNHVAGILKKLDKYGVHLNDNREIIIPSGTPRKIKEMLKTQEFTAALMYRDIEYEQKHRSHLDTIERKLQNLRQEYNSIKGHSDKDAIEVNKLLQHTSVNVPQESTYKLFESQEERFLRLEIKWWERRLNLMEIQILEQRVSSSPDESLETQIQEKRGAAVKRIEDLVYKLRYVKFKLEQENLKTTSELLFDEHIDLVKKKGNFTNSGGVYIEDITSYYNVPSETRRMTQNGMLNDDQISRMIYRTPLQQPINKLGGGKAQDQILESDIQDKSGQIKRAKIIERQSLAKMRQRVIKINDAVEEGEIDEVLEASEQNALTAEPILKAFIQESKQFHDETAQKIQSDLKQKEEQLAKNKNLKRKK